MAKTRTRKIGTEILQGIRELKRSEVGRVVTFLPITDTLLQPKMPKCPNGRQNQAGCYEDPVDQEK